jgi:hypothetical protein
MARSKLVKDILREDKKFFNLHGFYPRHAWLARKVGCTRERVRQIFSNYRDQRNDVVLFSEQKGVVVQLHPVIMEQVKKIEVCYDISFKDALKSWSNALVKSRYSKDLEEFISNGKA